MDREGASTPGEDKIYKTTILSCQDVAYALTTTLEEESLPKMDSLVDFYLDRLGQKLAGKKINLDIAEMRKEYDKVIFKMTRRYCVRININYYEMLKIQQQHF